MFNFNKKPFFRLSLITACILGWYQPEVALAKHHHVKKIKLAHHIHVTHKKHHELVQAKAVSNDGDFTINPDNSVVTSQGIIPAVVISAPETQPELLPTPAPTVVDSEVSQPTPIQQAPEPIVQQITEQRPAPQQVIVQSVAHTATVSLPMQPLLRPTPQHTTSKPLTHLISNFIAETKKSFEASHKSQPTPVIAPPVYVAKEGPAPTTQMFGNIAASMHKHIVDFVKRTVSTLRYSDYKLGGSKFDTSRGIYVVDCSSFVDHILKQVSPHAYSSLVNATGAPTPATQHYYEFFNELSENSNDYWNKVNNVEQLRAGDILVFRDKHNRHHQTSGHIMVVMEKPTKDMGVYLVRVADSAPSRHSEDTRHANESGIGIGTLLLKAAKGGRPLAYAWGIGGLWNKNVNFAMARPIEWD